MYQLTQFRAVNGVYSEWSSWGTCSVECGGGTQTQTRACDNPEPAYGGTPCVPEDPKSQECNTATCPRNYTYYPV